MGWEVVQVILLAPLGNKFKIPPQLIHRNACHITLYRCRLWSHIYERFTGNHYFKKKLKFTPFTHSYFIHNQKNLQLIFYQ